MRIPFGLMRLENCFCALGVIAAPLCASIWLGQPQATPSAPQSEQAPATVASTVGTRAHSGSHTWDGVIVVTSDNITLQDGVVTASDHAVPQGVTFHGDRRNVTLRNLTFTGMGDAISIGNNQRVDDLTLENCKFLECRTPDESSTDLLLGARGYGLYAYAGSNWTIRNSTFQAVSRKPKSAEDDCCSQYAMRLGKVHGVNVFNTRFENCGKTCVWLMFVRAAAFNDCEFIGGPIRIGVRPNDLANVEKGDCRGIVFRNCTFKFDSLNNWPAGILIFPGSEHIVLENCDVTTVPDSTWWLEVDERNTRGIRWRNIRWNGKPVQGYDGVRSSMSPEKMQEREIGPAAGPVEVADQPASGER